MGAANQYKVLGYLFSNPTDILNGNLIYPSDTIVNQYLTHDFRHDKKLIPT